MDNRRSFIPILLLMFTLWQCFYLPVARANTGDVIKQNQLLEQREKQIVAEILQVELALDRANREQAFVQSKLSETRTGIGVSKENLHASEEKLRLRQQRLNIWLKHFYMEGRTNYLTILLGAVDLGDFVRRLALVGVLVSRGVQDVNYTVQAIKEVEQKSSQLAVLEQQLASQEQRLEEIVSQLLALQKSKQQILEQTRRELGDNQSRVLMVANGLHDTLKPLATMMERFRDAPWEKYRPDRLQVLGIKVRAEYSESTISRLLFSGVNSERLIKANFSNHLLIIKGTNEEQVPFTIAGELSVAGDNVRYRPKSIVIGDMALSKELVAGIAGEEGLLYPVSLLMGWRLYNIIIEEGKAIFELSPT